MKHLTEKCFKDVDRTFQDISKRFLSREKEMTCTLEWSEIRNHEAILNGNLNSKYDTKKCVEAEGIVIYVVMKPKVCRGNLTPRSTPSSPSRKSSNQPRKRSRSAEPSLRSAPNLCYHRQYNIDQTKKRRLRCSHFRLKDLRILFMESSKSCFRSSENIWLNGGSLKSFHAKVINKQY